MIVTDEIFQSISGLIERTLMDAVRMQQNDQLTARTAKGLAHNVTVRICQHLKEKNKTQE